MSENEIPSAEGVREAAAEARRKDLLQDLLRESPYHHSLRDQAGRIAEVALGNTNVRRALDRIMADPDYADLRRIHRRRLAGPLRTIRHLFEWVYFASDTFVERARRG